MTSPLVLPRHGWGDPSSSRRALLVHGLGSTGALMWRFGVELSERGWFAEAVDLRGHGRAPRALDYTIGAYAADLAACRPQDETPWDLVIGHSLGGTAAVVAAASVPDWTDRLVLVDPAIQLDEPARDEIRESQQRQFDDPSAEAVRAEHPSWHPLDIELKVQGIQDVSRWAVEQTSEQNEEWDVRLPTLSLDMPIHIIAGDPAVYALFRGDIVEQLLTRPSITMSVVEGAGHSPHRDAPDETMRQLWEALA